MKMVLKSLVYNIVIRKDYTMDTTDKINALLQSDDVPDGLKATIRKLRKDPSNTDLCDEFLKAMQEMSPMSIKELIMAEWCISLQTHKAATTDVIYLLADMIVFIASTQDRVTFDDVLLSVSTTARAITLGRNGHDKDTIKILMQDMADQINSRTGATTIQEGKS